MAHDALNVDVFPGRVVGDGAEVADVGETVGLHVGFRHHEQSVDVAHFIETRVVRIVSGAYRVDVVLLHQQQIFFHAIHADRAAFQMVVIVAVHAVQHYVAVVDVEQAVTHFDIAETDTLRNDFQHLAGGVL